MNPEAARLQRMEALFHAASEMPAVERESFLQRECADDAALLEDVLHLLASEDQLRKFVPPVETEGEDRWIGKQIGQFHILERIGRGGMGVVYLGERRDTLFQTAAIKLMSFDLLPQTQARFLRERDVLAGLEHRHIVRLIGGGVTEDNFPYLAMEYVRGRRIDEACDDPETSAQRVLALFLEVCEAMEYVHRSLLLHRDLKPANVLVAEDGLVKLLDFGTFKSLQREDASLTQPGMQALTVRYASPEQLRAEPASTASDVFSLGVMLYRLLLGELPKRWSDRSIGQYLEALAADDPGPIALPLRQRRKINTHLASDVAAIIRKALRFRPEDRYQDAGALAADLRNAIAGRSIVAVRMGSGEKVVRFLRRNRSTALLAACTLAICIGGTVMLHKGSLRLREEQLRAEHGLIDEANLAHFLLVDYFEELKGIPESTNAQRQAISQALAYVDKLPEGVTQFQVDRLQAYTEMGSLLGNPYENNLGDTNGAIRELRKAVELGREVVSQHPDNQHDRELDADANVSLGRVYFGNGKPEEAERYLLAATEENRRLVAEGSRPDSAALAAAASTVDGLGDVYGLEGAANLHKPAEAIRAYKEAQALDARGLALDPACARCRRGIAIEYWKIGMLLPQPRDAAQSFEAGVRTLDAFPADERATARVQRLRYLILQKLGIAYLSLHRMNEGIRMLNEVRHQLQQTAAADPTDSRAHYDLYAMDFNMAEYLDVMGGPAEVLALDREIVDEAVLLERLDPANPLLKEHAARAKLRLGLSQMKFGDASRGMALALEARKTLSAMARAADASPDLLQAAADAEIAVHGNGAFAVQCASRARAAFATPSSNLMLTASKAYVLAGNLSEAHHAAEMVLHAGGKEQNEDAPTLAQDDRARAIIRAASMEEAERAIWPARRDVQPRLH